jgi:hypothetical protein
MPFPTKLKFIEDAEDALGAKFPVSFRAYLLQNNGGEIVAMDFPWEVNPVLDASDHEHVRRTAIDITRETACAREWHGFPSRGVAIASDGCGNYLILTPDENTPSVLLPAVYVWWHEGGELEVVASDFAELWQ